MNSWRWLAFGACLLGIALDIANSHAATFYVDSNLGNNALDGTTNVVVMGTSHGPMLTVSNAISAASSGDVLVVAAGVYQEYSWNLGANLTLLPQGAGVVAIFGQIDSVGDGIPDWWRQLYFRGSGMTTDATSCASCNPDGDGLSNLQEYLLGSNPTDPNSPSAHNPPGNLFFYDNLGRLAVVIGTNGTDAAFYDYDAVGNITDIRRQTIGALNLFEFSPVSGSGNTTITLQGTGFSATLTNNTVLFGSITAQVVNASANQLQVLVPTNAVNSLISVHSPLGVFTNSGTFTAGIGVGISPSSVTLSGLSTQQFTATVYGTNNQSVSWTLNGWIPPGTNTTWGSISTSGFYAAPTNPPPSGFVTVQATSVAVPDPLKAGVATITLTFVSSSVYGPIYSLAVSAEPGLPSVLGPVYSAAISAEPGLPNVIGPIYSPAITVTNRHSP